MRACLLLFLLLTACGSAQRDSDREPASDRAGGSGAGGGSGSESDPIVAAVGSSERTAEDRALDGGRRPAEILSFFGIAPGQRVADLFAGGGYTTELLAQMVGPSGRVFAQNETAILERFARAPLEARLSRLGMPHVVAVERSFSDPLPPEARELDAVIFVLAYHDTVWLGADRAAMNRAVFEALRPGGVYGIVDHHAGEGRGLEDVQTLHRIERQTLIDEVLAAGFRLEAESDLLRRPEDTRDWNASPRAAGELRGTSDRFVLRFVRP